MFDRVPITRLKINGGGGSVGSGIVEGTFIW